MLKWFDFGLARQMHVGLGPNELCKMYGVSNMKLILEVTKGFKRVTIHRDSQLDKFKCKLFYHGKHYEPADYYTDDKQDAIGTAKLMLQTVSVVV